MKNNINKQFKALVEENAPRVQELTYGEGDNQIVVKVYPVLPLTQRATMVGEIADGVFIGNKNTIESYHPELLEFMQKFTTLKFFTDLKMPKNIDDLWLFLNYTPVCDDVANLIGDDLREIFVAADRAIETRRQYLANTTDINSLFRKLGDALKDFEAKISKADIDKVLEGLKGLSNGETANILKSVLGANNA